MVQGIGERFQRLFTFLWFQLTLPYRDAVPPHGCQPLLVLYIPFLVPTNLVHPELPVRLRNLTALRIGKYVSFTKMHVRYFLSTRSGCPGSRLWFNLYLNPLFHNPRRTIISGFVSFPRIAAIFACRCCGVRRSIYLYYSFRDKQIQIVSQYSSFIIISRDEVP